MRVEPIKPLAVAAQIKAITIFIILATTIVDEMKSRTIPHRVLRERKGREKEIRQWERERK